MDIDFFSVWQWVGLVLLGAPIISELVSGRRNKAFLAVGIALLLFFVVRSQFPVFFGGMAGYILCACYFVCYLVFLVTPHSPNRWND